MINKNISSIEKTPKDPDLWEKLPKILPYPPYQPRIILYGIGGQEGTYVYACPGGWDNGAIQVYAVKTPPSTCEENTTDTKTTT